MVPPLPISLVWAIWLAILLVELATPPDVVLGILYGVPLLLGASQRTGRQAWRFLLTCCAVTLVNLLLPRPIDHNLVVVLVNRLLVCSGLAATTALVVRNQTLQQQRTALNVELAETQLRSDVIATLAHDLKTPVLGTLASLTMLEKGPLVEAGPVVEAIRNSPASTAGPGWRPPATRWPGAAITSAPCSPSIRPALFRRAPTWPHW